MIIGIDLQLLMISAKESELGLSKQPISYNRIIPHWNKELNTAPLVNNR
jgi:hypothetical protein